MGNSNQPPSTSQAGLPHIGNGEEVMLEEQEEETTQSAQDPSKDAQDLAPEESSNDNQEHEVHFNPAEEAYFQKNLKEQVELHRTKSFEGKRDFLDEHDKYLYHLPKRARLEAKETCLKYDAIKLNYEMIGYTDNLRWETTKKDILRCNRALGKICRSQRQLDIIDLELKEVEIVKERAPNTDQEILEYLDEERKELEKKLERNRAVRNKIEWKKEAEMIPRRYGIDLKQVLVQKYKKDFFKGYRGGLTNFFNNFPEREKSEEPGTDDDDENELDGPYEESEKSRGLEGNDSGDGEKEEEKDSDEKNVEDEKEEEEYEQDGDRIPGDDYKPKDVQPYSQENTIPAVRKGK